MSIEEVEKLSDLYGTLYFMRTHYQFVKSIGRYLNEWIIQRIVALRSMPQNLGI